MKVMQIFWGAFVRFLAWFLQGIKNGVLNC